MIALALVLAEAAPVLTGIGRQQLPSSGCAAFLWQPGPPPLLAAMADRTGLRIGIDGKETVLPRTAARGEVRLGLPASADFVGGGMTATLDLGIASPSDMADGARVPAATLSVSRQGGDTVVTSVAGLVGCAPARK